MSTLLILKSEEEDRNGLNITFKWLLQSSPIILLNIIKEGRHEFYEFSYTKRLTYLYTYPVLNFNLSSSGSEAVPSSSQLEVTTSKIISPEQIIKEPPQG